MSLLLLKVDLNDLLFWICEHIVTTAKIVPKHIRVASKWLCTFNVADASVEFTHVACRGMRDGDLPPALGTRKQQEYL